MPKIKNELAIIPNEIIRRKKQGFGTPIPEWLKSDSPLSKEMEDIVMNSGLRKRNIFDYSHIREIFSANRRRKADQSFKIWNLITLSLWYDRWFK